MYPYFSNAVNISVSGTFSPNSVPIPERGTNDICRVLFSKISPILTESWLAGFFAQWLIQLMPYYPLQLWLHLLKDMAELFEPFYLFNFRIPTSHQSPLLRMALLFSSCYWYPFPFKSFLFVSYQRFFKFLFDLHIKLHTRTAIQIR